MSDSSDSDATFESSSEENILESSDSVELVSVSFSEKKVENDSHVNGISCDQCGQIFTPKESVFTICDECKKSTNRLDEDNVLGKDSIEIDVNENSDDEPAGVINHEKASTPIANEEHISIGDGEALGEGNHIQRIELIEPAENFDSQHPHYSNPVFKSGKDVFDFLLEVERTEETVVVHFNNRDNPMKIHAQPSGDRLKRRNPSFICAQGCNGDYEGRIYYSYLNIAGYCSRQKSEGYICPSIVVEVDENGRVFDTGDRIVRLWLTRCATEALWALVYNVQRESFLPVVKSMFAYMKNRFTVIHLPFEYDATIRKYRISILKSLNQYSNIILLLLGNWKSILHAAGFYMIPNEESQLIACTLKNPTGEFWVFDTLHHQE